jgi:hypothetical protein
MEEHNLLSGLPEDYEMMAFSSFKKLQRAAKFVLDKLNANCQSGNQFIVVLDLPEFARTKLDNDKDVLGGIEFRFQFDETTTPFIDLLVNGVGGHARAIELVADVIKVPSAAHDVTTEI